MRQVAELAQLKAELEASSAERQRLAAALAAAEAARAAATQVRRLGVMETASSLVVVASFDGLLTLSCLESLRMSSWTPEVDLVRVMPSQ